MHTLFSAFIHEIRWRKGAFPSQISTAEKKRNTFFINPADIKDIAELIH
jgi:hypothetical protein